MTGARRVATLALLGAALGACAERGGDGAGAARGAVDAAAPDYAALTVAGDSAPLAAERGRVVLLNVWATWCQPCRAEIPALDTLHRRHAARGFEVVGVSIDAGRPPEAVARYARGLGASYPIWLDPDDRVSAAFGAYGVPASVLVDRSGMVRWRHVGPVTAGDTALGRAIEGALAAPAAPRPGA